MPFAPKEAARVVIKCAPNDTHDAWAFEKDTGFKLVMNFTQLSDPSVP
jgi:hypothetical protein